MREVAWQATRAFPRPCMVPRELVRDMEMEAPLGWRARFSSVGCLGAPSKGGSHCFGT